MHIAKNDIPTKIDLPGAVARQQTGFGDPSGYGTLGAEYFSLGAGADIAPLLAGLHDDACHVAALGVPDHGQPSSPPTPTAPRRPAPARTCSTGRPGTPSG